MSTLRQTYTVEVTGTILLTDMSPTFSDVWKFDLEVADLCPQDELTIIDSTFADYIYYIHEDTTSGTLTWPGHYTTQNK